MKSDRESAMKIAIKDINEDCHKRRLKGERALSWGSLKAVNKFFKTPPPDELNFSI